ncbi:SPFH domain-containing protein [Thalassoroseus pseudoceratinae]|uniref:SPFH domain-containing protein n=1 Tax=Thalassoroseus pseudoceratinae TaxID=2713176 RepID=UPI001421BA4C|nr:SPFH domain-containing protein [Thalassoroseus pseudoceratinae]
MGLFEKLRNELIDIIEWLDDSHSTLVWRFPRYQNEIKNGAQLIVRPGQVAIFVHRGELADVFEPGNYTLKTDNLPLLSTLQGWKYGFDSPFRSEVYFVSTKKLTGLKWGTPNPIMLRDPEFGPIRLRAFGTYSLKCQDPRALLTELVGTDSEFDSNEVNELLRSIIVEAFTDMLGEKNIAALDLASNYREISKELREYAVERVDDEYGLDLPDMFIVNISLPEAVEKAMDTRTSMGVIGDMGKYQAYQMGTAIEAAANNPAGGGASEGMGLGMGFAMANKFAQGGAAPAGAPVPPPPPQAVQWHTSSNGQTSPPMSEQQLGSQISAGQITPETYVWSAGMSGWQPASQVPQLAVYFRQTPPPPPPAAP